jgi:PAS domain S-box-containing protein
MRDTEKNKQQLLDELAGLRQRVAALEAAGETRQERLQSDLLLQSVPLGISGCDTEGRITFVNPACEAIIGYAADELVGGYVWDRSEPGPQKDSFPAFFKHIVAEQLAPTPYVTRIARKNGEVIDLRVDWSYNRDSQGQIVGFVSVLSDITEQKRMECELRQSRAALQAAVDCLPFDFFALGPDGRYILQNPASKRDWGDAVGKLPQDICKNPRDLEIWLDCNRRALAGERVEQEMTYSLHGEDRSCLAVLAPIRDDAEVYGVLGVNVDITKRKRAEEALRQSEERYRMLAESTTDMIYIMNRSGDVLYANRSAAAGICYDATNLVGKRQGELFSPDKVERHLESIGRVFETGEVFDSDGMYHFGPDELWLNTRLMPLRDEHGQVTAVMGVSRNITARKQAEAALKQAHDELERRVEERTAELAEANKAIQQSHDELQTIYDQMTDGVVVVDAGETRVLRVNSAFCLMVGRSEAEASELSPLQIHPPDVLLGCESTSRRSCVMAGRNTRACLCFAPTEAWRTRMSSPV